MTFTAKRGDQSILGSQLPRGNVCSLFQGGVVTLVRAREPRAPKLSGTTYDR
jgi:hypothetical protein